MARTRNIIAAFSVSVILLIFANCKMVESSAYKYNIKVNGDSVHKHYTIAEDNPIGKILCPLGFYIHSLSYEILGKASKKKSGKLDVVVSILDVDKQNDLVTAESPCKTLLQCIGYQACLFKFSIEFCGNDPIPNDGKVLNVNTECVRDSMIKTGENLDFVSNKSWLKVLLITHSSVSGQHRSEAALQDIEYYFNELPERDVFNGLCPNSSSLALASGYRGDCRMRVSLKTSREELWHVLGRAVSAVCRSELTQVYCAYKLNTAGQCAPPIFVASNAAAGAAATDQWQFGFQSLPLPGVRAIAKRHSDLAAYRYKNLLPARLAFAVLAYKEPKILLEMIKSLYGDSHYYVIHIDKRAANTRTEMEQLVRLWNVSNVRVLPESRSFITSWGSYGIVRAELECMEELLRMGVWDFFINLSYADMPLRSIHDIATALAPYRGKNFASVLKRRSTKPDNMGKYKSSAYAYHNCDGYLYRVVNKQSYPEHSDVVMTTQWILYSYDFAFYLLSDDGRRELRSQQFNLQTMSIPDEGYFQSLLLSSSYKSTFINYSPRYVNALFQSDIGTMSRKMNETDLRGQGPADLQDDAIPYLKVAAWKNFFSRKFSTDKNNRARQFARSWSKLGFEQEAKRTIEKNIITSVGKQVAKWYSREENAVVNFRSVQSWRIVAKLLASNRRCGHVHSVINNQHMAMNSLVEYSLFMDVNVDRSDNKSESRGQFAIRALVEPYSRVTCFAQGDLRVVFVTTVNRPAENIFKSPLPTETAGARQIFLHVFLEKTQHSSSSDAHYVTDRNGNNVLPLSVKLIKPGGTTFCVKTFRVAWHPMYALSGSTNVATDRLTVSCGTMEAGNWTIEMRQDNVESPRVYITHIYLTSKNVLPSSHHTRDLWLVKEVAKLPLDENFYDITTPTATSSHHPESESAATDCERRTKNDSMFISCLLLLLWGLLFKYILSYESPSNVRKFLWLFSHTVMVVLALIIVPVTLLYINGCQDV